MLYSGISPDTTAGYIGTSAFSSDDEDPMYVGYMYGTSGSLENNRTNENDSTIKTYVDTWYKNNLLTSYDKYISKTAIYCNDRSVKDGAYSMEPFDFGGVTRVFDNKKPTYKCGGDGNGGLFETSQAVEDKFSVSTSAGGNGQLTYPIALITADEVYFAGGMNGVTSYSPYAWFQANSEGYSITSSDYWRTMTPSVWHGDYYTHVLRISSLGNIDSYHTSTSNRAVRPVISLKACVKYASGDGSSSNPYEVTIDSTCENSEN